MMANIALDLALQVVEECSVLYNFDSSEAITLLNLGSVSIVSEPIKKRSGLQREKVVKEKVVKEKVVKEKAKKSLPLPFNGTQDMSKCCGLRQNHGLYTQCVSTKVEGDYCKVCDSEAKKNETGKPDNGRIEDRLSVGIFEFRDKKGNAPTPYTKVMKKLNLSKEQVLEEAGKQNIEINELHFMSPESKKGRPKSESSKEEVTEKKKGRPKKSKKVLEIETNDIFASLIAATNEQEEEEESQEESQEEEEVVVVTKKPKANDADKEAEKKKKDEEKAALKEAEKKKKDEEKAALKEAEKKKKDEEKALKEAEKKKKDEEKALKEAEEKALKEAEKKKKDEEKALKEAEKKKKDVKAVKEVVVAPKEEEEVKEKYVIINAKGQTKKTGLQDGEKKFLRGSVTGEVLSFTTQSVIGKWSKEESRIVFNDDYVESEEEDSDEEEEEEYDE
jgi:chemotaxis protein histidine kinase CheA